MDKPNTFSDRVDYDLSNDHGFDRGQNITTRLFMFE